MAFVPSDCGSGAAVTRTASSLLGVAGDESSLIESPSVEAEFLGRLRLSLGVEKADDAAVVAVGVTMPARSDGWMPRLLSFMLLSPDSTDKFSPFE